ncbi:MAG: hypothetical protein ABIP71_10475, partial [Verrucomicrobiota bacterium]
VQFGAGVELGLVALRLSVRGGGGGQGLRRRFALESAEVAFNLGDFARLPESRPPNTVTV